MAARKAQRHKGGRGPQIAGKGFRPVEVEDLYDLAVARYGTLSAVFHRNAGREMDPYELRVLRTAIDRMDLSQPVAAAAFLVGTTLAPWVHECLIDEQARLEAIRRKLRSYDGKKGAARRVANARQKQEGIRLLRAALLEQGKAPATATKAAAERFGVGKSHVRKVIKAPEPPSRRAQ